jgi:hypothetical protein
MTNTLALALLPLVASGLQVPLALRSNAQPLVSNGGARAALSTVLMMDDGSPYQPGWGQGPDEEAMISRAQHEARLARTSQILNSVQTGWVLLFNVGRPDEGVYTLQAKTEIGETSHVLVFEDTHDAAQFASGLQVEGFDLPTPVCWERQQLVNFCDNTQFDVSLVPRGAPITPPSKNEYDLDAFAKLELGQEHAFDTHMNDRMRLERSVELADQCETEDACDVDPQLSDREKFERMIQKSDECDVDKPDEC